MDLYKRTLHPDDYDVDLDDLEYIVINNIFVNTYYNDLVFRVKDRFIILVEHQSTFNPNMPLRMLIYACEEYRRYILNNKNLYSSRLIKLPAPEFYLVYTGVNDNRKELLLSEAYNDLSGANFLQLRVKVLDEKYPNGVLYQYKEFINRLTEQKERFSNFALKDILKVIDSAITDGILTKYLTSKRL